MMTDDNTDDVTAGHARAAVIRSVTKTAVTVLHKKHKQKMPIGIQEEGFVYVDIIAVVLQFFV